MARPEGAPNKNKPNDHEDIFLSDALRGYTFWKGEAAKLKQAGQDATQVEEYAEAYRLLLNRFTIIEKK
jgi:hypothetical protein